MFKIEEQKNYDQNKQLYMLLIYNIKKEKRKTKLNLKFYLIDNLYNSCYLRQCKA